MCLNYLNIIFMQSGLIPALKGMGRETLGSKVERSAHSKIASGGRAAASIVTLCGSGTLGMRILSVV